MMTARAGRSAVRWGVSWLTCWTGVLTLCYLWRADGYRLQTPNGTLVIYDDGESWPQRLSLDKMRSTDIINGSLEDHFTLLYKDKHSILLGARNKLHNISLSDVDNIQQIEWTSSDRDVLTCTVRQDDKDVCHNYIQIATRLSQQEVLVCGTNSFKPTCRTYRKTYDGYSLVSEESGVGKCPYTPYHSSTGLHVDGRLFSATVADPTARDALIYREPLRTEQHDSQWLNGPQFVSSYDFDDKIYFFFRENAVENINCKKAVFSRVARICKGDQGGARVLRSTWTSFFKAKLNCSIPGDYPFYFDEIQSTSEIAEGNVVPSVSLKESRKMIYGIFNTPENSFWGSAVCAFKMSDISATFSGPFKEQKSSHSSWLPVKEIDTPSPHPAKYCANDSLQMSDQTLNFIKSHPLMDGAVPSWTGKPLLVQSSFKFRLTKVAVDWQVHAADGRYYDVLFLGTDDGRVIKTVNIPSPRGAEAVVIEDVMVFADQSAVTGLSVDRGSDQLIVVSSSSVRSITLSNCNQSDSCRKCTALRSPYCAWSKLHGCSRSIAGTQNIESGTHPACESPTPTTTPLAVVGIKDDVSSETESCDCTKCLETCVPGGDNAEPKAPISAESCEQNKKKSVCTGGILTAAILCSIVIALLVGFIVGYRFSVYRSQRDCALTKQENNQVKVVTNTYEVEPHNHRNYLNKHNEDYLGQEKQLNVDFKFNSLGKTLNSSVETTIQPNKVKKVYV